MVAPAAARSSRLAGIEGLRALAAASILVYHVWLYGAPDGRSVQLGPATKAFDNLRAGVTLFFVLSGFLLFRPYVSSALRGRPSPSLGNYLRNRALRIVPAYWLVLLGVAALFHHSLLTAPRQLLANAFFLQDYVKAYMPSENGGVGIVPAWSLAIEVVFYLVVPLLGAAAIAVAARHTERATAAVVAPVVGLAAVGVAAKVAARVFDLGPRWELAFPCHADWFAAGMAVAVVRILWEDNRLALPRGWLSGSALTALLLALTATKLYYGGSLSYLEYQSPIAVACALLLAVVVLSDPSSRGLRVLASRPFVAVGLASYSLFLWHDPFVRALRDHGWTRAGASGFALNLLLVAAIAGVLAALSYLFVERPALSLKRRWRPNETPAPAVVPPSRAPDRAAPTVGLG